MSALIHLNDKQGIVLDNLTYALQASRQDVITLALISLANEMQKKGANLGAQYERIRVELLRETR